MWWDRTREGYVIASNKNSDWEKRRKLSRFERFSAWTYEWIESWQYSTVWEYHIGWVSPAWMDYWDMQKQTNWR